MGGFFLRIFAKAAAMHPKKYPYFNKFSLLHIDSLKDIDALNIDSPSIPVPISVSSILLVSSIALYKPIKSSTIHTKNTYIDLDLTCNTMLLPINIIPILVYQDLTLILPKADPTLVSLTTYNSIPACCISEITPSTNHFSVQSLVNKEKV